MSFHGGSGSGEIVCRCQWGVGCGDRKVTQWDLDSIGSLGIVW